MKMELYALYDAFVRVAEEDVPRVCLFSDSLGALQMLASMHEHGDMVPVWDAFVPLLNQFQEVAFGWSPGHASISGTEIADVGAKKSALEGLPVIRSLGLDIG